LEEHFSKDGKIVTDVFDPETKGTPLHKIVATIERRLKDISDKLSEQEGVKTIESLTPRKGFKFEVECENCLREILKNQKHGDKLNNTGTKRGEIQGRIVGDFVINLSNGLRNIVLEAKDVKKGKYSLSRIHTELDEAIKNRNTNYGIFVVKNVNSIDSSNGYFHEYGDNKLVIALGNSDNDALFHSEILFIAYKWARLRLKLESIKPQKKFDASYVTEKARLIQNDIKEFAKIITKCGNVETAADEIRGIAERLHHNIDRELGYIIESLDNDNKPDKIKIAIRK
jgi:hypothetical protein